MIPARAPSAEGRPRDLAPCVQDRTDRTGQDRTGQDRTGRDSLEDRTGLGLGRPPHRAPPSVKVGKPSGAKSATSLLNKNEVANFRRIAPHGQPTLKYRETRIS